MSGAILTGFGIIVSVLGAAAGLGTYLAPTIVAMIRHAPNTGSIAVINIALGWSLIGWVIALAMAMRSTTAGDTGSVTVIQNASGQPPGLPPAPPYVTWEPPRWYGSPDQPELPVTDDPPWSSGNRES